MTLIIGASGLVGGVLYKLSENAKGTYNNYPIQGCKKLDITDRKNVIDLVHELKPDKIFLPAALTNVDFCEEHPDISHQINVLGTRNVVEAAKLEGSKMIFFSTDYIFDGKDGPYSENDITNPINIYGKDKLKAEKIVMSMKNSLVIRTTVVYGNEKQGKNFVLQVIKTLRENKTIKVPVDQIGTPTFVNNLAENAIYLAEKDKVGIYNVVGCDLASRYDFANSIANVFKLDKSLIMPVETSQLMQKAARPLKLGLKTGKLHKETRKKTVGIRKGLEFMKNDR